MKKYFGIFLLFIYTSCQAQFIDQQKELSRSEQANFSLSHLFNQYKSDVYQILVINDATGQKTSIGSGFVIGDGQLLATNYHVISDVLQKEHHHLEYIDNYDQSGRLTLLDVDVIHDLAIVRADNILGEPMTLGNLPAQGESLYALGNPHDLGFIIVDGINNGLLKKSARARILFSGALNAGMSGGPTLNQAGEVVGINVSYLNGGNNISFIVPAPYLNHLLQHITKQPANINQSITTQLIDDNIAYYQDSLTQQWPSTVIKGFTVPLAMRDDVRCWDNSPQTDEGELITAVSVACFNDRLTFINNSVSFGLFGYSYTFFNSQQPISSLHFYKLFTHANQIKFTTRPKKDFGDFSCTQDFVTISQQAFKITLCRRPSKHFNIHNQRIENMRMIAAQVNKDNQGLLISVSMDGVQKELGFKVLEHLLEQIHDSSN